jgi:periplasmic protein TonB
MFEMVLAGGGAGQTQRGAGVVASFFLHGAALVAAVALSAGAKQVTSKLDRPLPPVVIVSPTPKQLSVTFQEPGPSKPSKPANAAVVQTQTPRAQAAKPPPADLAHAAVKPDATPISTEASAGGSGPQADAPPGPTGNGSGGNGKGDGPDPGGGGGGMVVVPMMPGMARPVRISGADPAYTPQALQARIEGKVHVKCNVMVDGSVRSCQIVKGLPHMDQAVLQALSAQRYQPAMFQGRPVSVSYVFSFNFKLP